MAIATTLLLEMSKDRFRDVFSVGPKKLREEVFRRAGIKNRNSSFSIATGKKNEIRVAKLFDKLMDGLEMPEEVAEEIIRGYLFTQRSLLGDALDILGVSHDEGLTEEDLDFVAELEPDKAKALFTSLVAKHSEDDVLLYLRFMNIPVVRPSEA